MPFPTSGKLCACLPQGWVEEKYVFVLISIALHQHRHMDQPYNTFWPKHCYISSDGHRWIMHELLFGWILQEMLSSHFHILKVLMTDTTMPSPPVVMSSRFPGVRGNPEVLGAHVSKKHPSISRTGDIDWPSCLVSKLKQLQVMFYTGPPIPQ